MQSRQMLTVQVDIAKRRYNLKVFCNKHQIALKVVVYKMRGPAIKRHTVIPRNTWRVIVFFAPKRVYVFYWTMSESNVNNAYHYGFYKCGIRTLKPVDLKISGA